jgi:signal transduction histidine kinase
VTAKRPRSRLFDAAVLLVIGLLGPLGAWFVTGWSGVRRLQTAIDRQAEDAAQADRANIAGRLAAILQVLRERESQRPYFHYQNLYHDPRGADLGYSVVPSPLVEGPNDPLIETYFQIDPKGTLTVPSWNEEVSTLNVGPNAEQGKEALARLRPAAGALVQIAADGVKVEPAPSVVVAQNDAPSQGSQGSFPSQGSIQQVLDNSAYQQNNDANQIYQQIKGKKAQAAGAKPGDVMVTIEPLRYSAAKIDGFTRLVALRGVQTPDGRMTQGFVLSTEALRGWLAIPDRAQLVLTDQDVAPDAANPSALPLVHGALRVMVNARPEADRAEAKAALSRELLWRFVPVSFATILACGLVLFVVAQTERLARQRSQFAASAAHELRTPLAGLRLYAEMLEAGLGDPEKSGDYARRIGDEAARLGRVVGNVLGFSQLERGTIVARKSRGDLAAWLTDTVARLSPGLEALGAKIDLAIDVEPLDADFDPDALGQIVQNLVDNAEKYAREANDRTIHVQLRVSGRVASIEVRDHGPGIALAQRATVFDPFVRGDLADQPAGVGLGLSISRALARAHGGDLTLADADEGARFELSLPLS